MEADRCERRWESNFGREEPFAIGVEEELLLVDAGLDLAGHASRVLRRADPEEGDLSDELFTSMIEAKSEVSRTAAEATAMLREARREVLASGSRLMGAGVHPSAESGEADVRDSTRYLAIARMLQGILRTPICGQHVHVGMLDPETAVRAYNGIRTHVPLINALAANSPFWFGEDSGLASSRTVIFRSYPRAAMAPQFTDFDDFCHVTRQVCVAADLDDYTHIWWDARIHPGLGTIEVRAPDAQFDLRRVSAVAALVHCLARVEADRDQSRIPAREALAESAFQATRHGLAAKLLDRDAEAVPAKELGMRTLELAWGVAGELECEDELAYVERMLEEGSGADLQRAVHRELGMEGLLAWLCEQTADLESAVDQPSPEAGAPTSSVFGE
jgi:carboxylate-amine ligase